VNETYMYIIIYMYNIMICQNPSPHYNNAQLIYWYHDNGTIIRFTNYGPRN